MCNVFSSRDHGLLVDLPWHDAPRPYLDASELIISFGRGVIKDLLFYRLRFRVHRNSSAVARVERCKFLTQDFWVIIHWICWCWRDLYQKGAVKKATAVEDSLFISFLRSLIATVSFFKKFPHWVCNFSTFSLGMSFLVNLFRYLEILKLM